MKVKRFSIRILQLTFQSIFSPNFSPFKIVFQQSLKMIFCVLKLQFKIALPMSLTESESIEGKLQTDVIVQLHIKSQKLLTNSINSCETF